MTELSAAAQATAPVVVARVPVVDADRTIVGFELVTRAVEDATAHPHGGSREEPVLTVAGLLGTADTDLASVVSDKLLFCPVDRDVLVGDVHLGLPPRRTVLELPHGDVDADLLEAARAHRHVGFTLLVDHAQPSEGYDALVALAGVVRVDLGAGTPEELLAAVDAHRGSAVRLLATGCDSEAQLDWALAAGFHLFSGRAVQALEAAPVTAVADAPLPLSQLQLGMELLSQDLDFDRIEDLLRGDPGLVVQLLNMTSSGAGGGLRRQVRSLREALVVMGTARLRQWAALVILSRHCQPQTDALVTTLVRARMCELLARARGVDGPFAFTAGLLSALHVLLGVPVSEVERQVKVDEELADAAFGRHGTVGDLVTRVIEHEQSLGTDAPRRVDHDQVTLIGAMAFGWAASYVEALDSAAPA
ncbi:EAL and HDOD domain-containing protein [Nocardioides solisilvae]|uniref:EAL and HDOD domain-containing protein n=1 Tax=Nocardioides solisilvae TaxID=1542435 RepID=UPI0013A596D2|nr:HDOD domain-containing protein [Nocardioides solisilvae]